MIPNISLIAQSAIKIINNEGKIIYFDPFKLNGTCEHDADIIFITHSHFDHFSPEDIEEIRKESTRIVAPQDIKSDIKKLGFLEENVLIVIPNEKYEIDGVRFETIPAYNTNKDFHKKEYNWVGYIATIDDKRIYIAGDTDNIEEARNIICDIAMVPVGGTYTMTAEEAADLIKNIKPKLAIPIHYKTIVGSIEDAETFKKLLENQVEVEILMR